MFEIYFEGKYKHHLAKAKVENPHLLEGLDVKLKYYEIVALHSVLDDEHFQKLQMEKSDCQDCLGIITGKNRENKAVFEHLTFAEYFVSKFFVKNFDKARILKEEIFSQKYQNLLLIFNIMLAEDSPLHLAIIYQDLDRIEEIRDQSSLVDKGGRNFLQVAACVATRHPPLECSRVVRFRYNNWFLKKLIGPEFKECIAKDNPVRLLEGENSNIKEIVNRVLLSEPFKKDEIFEWNSLDYALAAGALYIVEAILEKCGKFSNFYMMLGKYYSDEVVAYYSIRFGYYRLLSEILAKKSCRVSEIVSDYLTEENRNNSILNFIFMSDYTNRTRIVESILTNDNVNYVNKTVYGEGGYTFLHLAIFHDDIELVKFLLGRKVNVDIKDKSGCSTLCMAIKRNNIEISKLLVENGADVNLKDQHGRSPLFYAVNRNYIEISKLLFENGADVNIIDKFGRSPLFYAVKQNNIEISKLLLKKGAQVNRKDEDGWSPLCLALQQNNIEISKLLVEKVADVNIQDKFGRSPLVFAVQRNNLEILKLLVEKGADVNIKDKYGRSPLLFFIKRNNLEISKLLVEKGADVNIKDTYGGSPLFHAVERNNLEISKFLVEKGADVNIQDTDGFSPLCSAVVQNNLENSKLLIENGADVNIQDTDGWSLLRLAVERNNLEISKLLVENGADVNLEDTHGRSPLFYAVKQNKPEILKLLLKKEGTVNSEIKDALYSLLPEKVTS